MPMARMRKTKATMKINKGECARNRECDGRAAESHSATSVFLHTSVMLISAGDIIPEPMRLNASRQRQVNGANISFALRSVAFVEFKDCGGIEGCPSVTSSLDR